jgi:hypothetical protein
MTLPRASLLTVLGLSFSHTLFWLSVLAQRVIIWLVDHPWWETRLNWLIPGCATWQTLPAGVG